MKRWMLLMTGFVAFVSPMPAHAQMNALTLIRSLREPRDWQTGTGRSQAELPDFVHDEGRVSVLVRKGSRWTPFDGSPSELEALVSDGARVTWAPPLHPRLDSVRKWIGAEPTLPHVGGSGAGAVVGIIDTGVDPTHGDLRSRDGSSRIAYYMDFSQEGGGDVELEAEYCESDGGACAIYPAAQLDQLIADGYAPADTVGHGTHVASLAAGNGLGTEGAQYAGIAPEATLLVARVVRPNGTIVEGDVLRATRFIFERAEALGLPAVVNVSLGTDFGGHDGTAALERALASFVGDHPGRALVVAAGNAGEVYESPGGTYPEPLGIHSEVHVPWDTEARVPILSLTGREVVRAQLYIWIGFRPEDTVSVGVDRSGQWISPVSRGRTVTWEDDGIEVTIYNEPRNGSRAEAAGTEVGGIEVGNNAAVVIIDGEWSAEEVFAIRLRGHGTARLWVQSEGDLSPSSSTKGALFSGASVSGTINVPGTHPDIIAVGASVNRDTWPTRSGTRVELSNAAVGTVSSFSSAGPTATGWLKPDIVAPGDYVVGAMASRVDPATTSRGLFNTTRLCDFPECLVVDDAHAVSSGTSMAAPVVSGAIALLLADQPELTSREVRALLQAGARRVKGLAPQSVGAGALDIDAAFAALDDDRVSGEPSPQHSWLALADDLVRPDPKWPLRGLLQLRDESGHPADGFEAEQLVVRATPGVVEALQREAPGLWSFSVRAPSGSGGRQLLLEARYGGEPLVTERVRIAVDRSVAQGGATVRGGCSVSPSSKWRTGPREALFGALWAMALGLRALGSKRRSRRTNSRFRAGVGQVGCSGR